MKQLFAAVAVIALTGLVFAGCDKKDGAVTSTTTAGRYDAAATTEVTTESLKEKLDDAMETVSEKVSDAMETVSEKLSEAGSTIREGITDLSEAMTGDGASRP